MQKTIWITGLSGAGKSTLGMELCQMLRERGEFVIFLDGDKLREVFGAVESSKKNHGREGRLNLAMQYSKLCNVIAEQGFTLIIATISMFKEVHKWNRENLPNYFEIFLKVPIDVLKSRDPKGIYHRYDTDKLSDIAGLDLEVDEPIAPDILFDYNNEIITVEQMVNIVISQHE